MENLSLFILQVFSSGDEYSVVLRGIEQDQMIDNITIHVLPSQGMTAVIKDLYLQECTFPLGEDFCSDVSRMIKCISWH